MDTTNGQFRFSNELKVIRIWAWILAVIAFVAAQFFFNVAILHHAHPGEHIPPPFARPLLGLLAGTAGACWILLVGYVSGDSSRRGMSPWLWTAVSIFVPYGMGILLYFILRQNRRESCPQCGYAVKAGFNFCPRCSYKLGLNCPQCQKAVAMNDVYCPYCGTTLRPASAAGSTTQSGPSPANT